MDNSRTKAPCLESIDCGSSHSLALIRTLEGNIVVSWGRGEDGQLGHGDAEERLTPHAIFHLINKRVSSIHCGAEYSVAVSKEDEMVYSWGWGDFGRLGHADCKDVFLPTPIQALSGVAVRSVSCGDTHTLVTTQQGRLYAFGRNQNGQLGDGTTNDCLEPKQISALEDLDVCLIACGAEHSMCCTTDGQVFSWGWGRYGNIGDGGKVDRHTPAKLIGLEGIKVSQIACGWRHSLAVDDKGSLFSWGWSKYGQLGHGDTNDQLIPEKVKSLQNRKIHMVAGGWRHSLATDSNGNLFSWGWNKFGQLGLGHNNDTCSPCEVKLPSNRKVRKLASGWRHTMVVTENGELYSWGRGVNGQLGLNSTVDANSPREVPALSADTISVEKLIEQSHPVVMHSIPPSDRYALVPDAEVGGIGIGQAVHAVPDSNDQTHSNKKKRI